MRVFFPLSDCLTICVRTVFPSALTFYRLGDNSIDWVSASLFPPPLLFLCISLSLSSQSITIITIPRNVFTIHTCSRCENLWSTVLPILFFILFLLILLPSRVPDDDDVDDNHVARVSISLTDCFFHASLCLFNSPGVKGHTRIRSTSSSSVQQSLLLKKEIASTDFSCWDGEKFTHLKPARFSWSHTIDPMIFSVFFTDTFTAWLSLPVGLSLLIQVTWATELWIRA